MSYFNFDPTKSPDFVYDQGYEVGLKDGIRQERERVQEALLSEEAAQGLSDSYWMIVADGWMKPLLAAICDRIGLGAVTTEESEHE